MFCCSKVWAFPLSLYFILGDLPPPPRANIYTEAVRKEGEKEGRPTKYFFIVHSLYNITLHQNSILYGSIVDVLI